MKRFPALAALEFEDIAMAVVATDALLKRAPIARYRSGTIAGGRYLTLFAGTTASVDESYIAGVGRAESALIDQVFLPHVHPHVFDAVFGKRTNFHVASLAIVETPTVCASIAAADRILKGTDVRLLELRLADSILAGKGLAFYGGELHEIDAALDIADGFFHNSGVQARTRRIPAPNEGLVTGLQTASNFGDAEYLDLDGEEL